MLKLLLLGVTVLLIPACTTTLNISKQQEIDAYLNSINFSGTVLISQNKKIILSKGYGYADRENKIKNNIDTQFLIGSITKSFTALAIMQLQEKQLLDINDPVTKYLPSLSYESDLTIKHLLTHTSGIYNYTRDYSDIKNIEHSPSELENRFINKPLEFNSGDKFQYSNSGYVLLGLIIEKVSGLNYEEYLSKNIFTPLKMEDSSYGFSKRDQTNYATLYIKDTEQSSPNISIAYSSGGIASTTEDLFRWGNSFDTNQLVSNDSNTLIFTHDRSAKGMGFGTGKFKFVMGLGWVIVDSKYGFHYYTTGYIDGYSSIISKYPEKDTTIIILTNDSKFKPLKIKSKIMKILY